jgi:integrase
VFTSETGRPINPSTDYHAWKALLKGAGVREARLHDARHTPRRRCSWCSVFRSAL